LLDELGSELLKYEAWVEEGERTGEWRLLEDGVSGNVSVVVEFGGCV
jgi:hypothetical protein